MWLRKFLVNRKAKRQKKEFEEFKKHLLARVSDSRDRLAGGSVCSDYEFMLSSVKENTRPFVGAKVAFFINMREYRWESIDWRGFTVCTAGKLGVAFLGTVKKELDQSGYKVAVKKGKDKEKIFTVRDNIWVIKGKLPDGS